MPLLIIGVAYAGIGINLRRSANPQSSLPALKTRKKKHPSYQNTSHDCDPVPDLFAAWTNRLAFLDFGGQNESEITQTIFKFVDILDILHPCLNLTVYGLSNKHFRRECIQHFCDCFTFGSQ